MRAPAVHEQPNESRRPISPRRSVTLIDGKKIMGLDFKNLDDATRRYMIEEIEIDEAAGTLYLSPWLTEAGCNQWATLLKTAARQGNDDTLAAALRNGGYIRTLAERRKPTGGVTTYRIPGTAAETMAGEFNLFYIRALCRRAIDGGNTPLQVYRARPSSEPRPESVALIDTFVDARATLEDLRQTHGTKPSLGFPPGPNSGLTARLLNELQRAV